MTSVAQQIPNFVQGISDQPDVLKRPGQVRDMVNMFPDVTNTVTKRPGTEYINTLGTDATGTWFCIHKENPSVIRERYIGCINKTGELEIWSCDSGVRMDVVYQSGGPQARYPESPDLRNIVLGSPPDYFKHNRNQQLKLFSVNDYTFVCNPLVQVSMSGSWPANRRDFESFIEITTIAYNRQYALDISEPQNDDTVNYRQATEVDVYDTSGFDTSDGSCAQSFSSIEEFNETFGSREASNLRLELTTTGQQIPEEDADQGDAYDCVYKHTANILFGGERWREGDKFEFVKQFDDDRLDDITYRLEVKKSRLIKTKANVALVRPTPTPATAEKTITAEEILSNLLTEITEKAPENYFEEARIVGNGIYLRAKTAFTVDTPEETLFNIVTNQTDERTVYQYNNGDNYTWLPYYIKEDGTIVDLGVNDVIKYDDVPTDRKEDWMLNAYPRPVARVNNIASLPRECINGLVVKVVNSENTKDDYYSEFKGDYGLDGSGIWEECAEPGGTHTFNPSSLPHQIVRSNETRIENGNLITKFIVSTVDWNSREAGDDETVPRPSFAPIEGKPNSGKTISNIKLFRNRFLFLSDENVVTSRAGDFFNLWGKSALTVTADDPVDLTCSSNYASYPSDCIVINTGLVIFSPFNQFLLTTDNDVFSPATAKIKDISSYDYNTATEPFYLGTNIGFLATETSASKLYEMTEISRDGQPIVVEQSKLISRSLAPNITRVAASKEMGLVLFSDRSKTVWGYKYFADGEKKLQSAFFKWNFSHVVVDHCIMDDTYYVVLGDYYEDQEGTDPNNRPKFDDIVDTHLCQINLGKFVQQQDYNEITTAYKYIDFAVELTPVNDRIYIPYSGNFEVYRDGVPVQHTNLWPDVIVQGSEPVTVGIPYTGSITLPTIYVNKKASEGTTRSEWAGSLVIHRLKFQMGLHGAYNIHIKRKGRDDYNVLYESTIQDAYPANFNTSTLDIERVVPVYTRNTDMELSISSNFPAPMTIHSLQWEGDYNPKYYKIV